MQCASQEIKSVDFIAMILKQFYTLAFLLEQEN